ncbi:carboxylesterase/lipase family protein [Sphingomonas canadensis]|uniref:Carboxylic ester hydrolase n=1 Tax=Sphingomonas canadensis TaxID=1219257 RepID=A0ABW3H870_9SPHN|nr:carboxylesterase family protein [Sphingomonas canadensis]MCW3836978.1 carboxylesterase family protein [Sphingomonas canadensis]
MLRSTCSAIALMLLTLPGAAPAAAQPPVPHVSVAQGKLAGSSADGVRRFFGIPFAAPPVGDLRWKAPKPAAPWAGVRDASSFGATCMQSRFPGEDAGARPPMSEDCLTLNVWTPEGVDGPMPVMVWIHGGGFMAGSNRDPAFDGTAFAKKGIVLVTINYRLGALGFIAHPELSAEAPYRSSGNYGMLDQIAALKWIRENIGAFGGDPGNVTIFGESAGSTAISILQASPLAKGLFDKVIGESTSQFDPDGGLIGRKNLRQAEEYGKAFGEKLNAPSLAALRALKPEQILAQPTFFWPTERDGYLLPDIVYNRFARGAQNDVPTLVGSNSDEGATIRMDWIKRAQADPASYDRIYGGEPDQLRRSATDAVQWQMRSWARLQARTGKNKAWLFWFDQPWPGRQQLGAFHGAEIVYVFKTLETEDQPWTDGDRKLSALMFDYWVNFARTGDPNGAGLPHWPSYSEANPMLMRLAPDAGAIPEPRAEAQAFLDAYFDARR